VGDEAYVKLIRELEGLATQHGGLIAPTDLIAPDNLWNEPEIAVRVLLYRDAIGQPEMPDDVIARVWEIGWALECDPDFLMPDDTLATARPGRRTRPPEPVRYPLRGGGHGSGRGIPGKTEYPARWSDDDATEAFMSIATSPDGAVKQPDGSFRAWGVRDGVEIRVIVTELGHVETAYPVSGDGVVTNPLDETRAPYVDRLRDLVQRTEMAPEDRAGIDELMQVGEWDQVVLQLRALPVPDRAELEQLAAAAGITTPG
jgi:hypothetical protein